MALKDGTKHTVKYGLANVLCRKDNGDIIKNTILPDLQQGVNAVENGKLFSQKFRMTMARRHGNVISFLQTMKDFAVTR